MSDTYSPSLSVIKDIADNQIKLRDYFAGQALAGLLASGRAFDSDEENDGVLAIARYNLADDAYRLADAMMLRGKQGNGH